MSETTKPAKRFHPVARLVLLLPALTFLAGALFSVYVWIAVGAEGDVWFPSRRSDDHTTPAWLAFLLYGGISAVGFFMWNALINFTPKAKPERAEKP